MGEPGSKSGHSCTEFSSLRQVVFADRSRSRGSIVRARRSHSLGPGQPYYHHPSCHHPVDQLAKGGFKARVAACADGESGTGTPFKNEFLPQIALIVQPLLEGTGNAAPIGRTENQAVCGFKIIPSGIIYGLEGRFSFPVAGHTLGDGQGHALYASSLGVVKDQDRRQRTHISSHGQRSGVGAIAGVTAIQASNLALLLYHFRATKVTGQLMGRRHVIHRNHLPHLDEV